ncbi:hypothetical protein [Chryseobacterium schmidteae]|uniref:hypothetical protein n=1 Tax=Chryseobacterium schmidteae TaxID=2730404 RepID=UPI001E29BF72|nr:hypothetical protein [Chryseobacterium schmidteae]
MRISFDLDDTIISTVKFPLEKESFWSKIIGAERIRLGTIKLFKELRTQDHQIYVYTTSYRSKVKIKLMFLCYGIPVEKSGKMFQNSLQNLILTFILMTLLV